jgi:sporulation protein YlmC with PRC-barrel domain
MHLLRSTAIGTEIIDNIDHHIQGIVTDLLIDPDRGKLLALFIICPHASGAHGLLVEDIATWGNRIHVRESEVIGPLEDFVRLQPSLGDPRTLIGQRIRTKSGVNIGKCVDVQFRTDTFAVEWIFPRRFFRKGLALPTSDILEITPDAIIVKNQNPREEKMRVEKETIEEEIEAAISKPAIDCSSKEA